MATNAVPQSAMPSTDRFDHPTHPGARWGFLLLLAGGIAFASWRVVSDMHGAGETLAVGGFAFLGVALLIALAFEFVNGFHDTANAVATVIYTNSLTPPVAVAWSGLCNFLGVVASSGAVAYSIVTLLPVELILNVGSTAGYAMIFALLIAALLWNLLTWYFGIPNSSSHALIGSILGVGLANQLLSTGRGGTSGVDWGQAEKVLSALLISPLMGFFGALGLFFVLKALVRNPTLYKEPEADAPPPKGIRALLIFTCTAVSFAHGGNDGQKGMGLIMLILIGVAPTAYALNRTMADSATPAFVHSATLAERALVLQAGPPPAAPIGDVRVVLKDALQKRDVRTPAAYAAMGTMAHQLSERVAAYGSIAAVPAGATANMRNDMYLELDAIRMATKDKDAVPPARAGAMTAFAGKLEDGTRYIPIWVKIVVAIALGLGTMVGWKRIVVTVGERIGKKHLTYAMGASAELVAASTILLAELKGLPVSTTHILSSGVAGAAVGNGQGLQGGTIARIVSAWVLTLPVAMLLSGLLYWLFLTITGTSLT